MKKLNKNYSKARWTLTDNHNSEVVFFDLSAFIEGETSLDLRALLARILGFKSLSDAEFELKDLHVVRYGKRLYRLEDVSCAALDRKYGTEDRAKQQDWRSSIDWDVIRKFLKK